MCISVWELLTKCSAMKNQKIVNNYNGSSNMSDWNLTDWLIDWLFKILECAWLRRFFGFFSWTTYLRVYLLFCFLIVLCDEVIHVTLFKLCLQNIQKQNTCICHWYGYPAQSLLSSMTFHNVIVFQCFSLIWLDTNTNLHGILDITIEFDNCSVEKIMFHKREFDWITSAE